MTDATTSQRPPGLDNFWETVCQDLLQTKTFFFLNHQAFLPFAILNTIMLFITLDFSPEKRHTRDGGGVP